MIKICVLRHKVSLLHGFMALLAAMPSGNAAHAQVLSATGSVVQSASTLPSGADNHFRKRMLSWRASAAIEEQSRPPIRPVESFRLSSSFGIRADPFRGAAVMHNGIDIPGDFGTPVFASADGMVARAEHTHGYGNLVQIDHSDGIQTWYAHLSRILVARNTVVKRGQVIAFMGSTGRSTGNHLHYEVRVEGRAIDPLLYLTGKGAITAFQKSEQTSAVPYLSAFARARIRDGS